jgi:HAE1 family hydrophobic/amphiphilic exporter-1
LEHRRATLLAGTAFFLASIALMVVVPKSFYPRSDFASAIVAVELPPGVRLEDTARVSAQVRDILAAQPEVTDIIESVGGGDVRNATLYVSLVPRSERKADQKTFENRVRPLFAAVRA